MRFVTMLAVMACCWPCAPIPWASAADASPSARTVDDFSLPDFRGKRYALSDFQDRTLVVIAFLGTECPLAIQYAPRLNQLAERYAQRGVTFLGINSNAQDSPSELAAYAKSCAINFPLLKDLNNGVADRLGAARTPEVFVLDTQRAVRYRGRIDDQFVPGRQRKAPTRDDLATAIDELLAGSEVSIATTEAAGCRIGRVHRAQNDAKVTYAQHIAPLLDRHCVECHRAGEIGPFALTDYQEVSGWAEMMLEVVEDNRMPPWHASAEHGHFANDRRLSNDEKQLLREWVAAGAPEGNPAERPAPPKFVDGWRLPRVDRVIAMAKTPFAVPAEGTVDYQYFTVDPGFTADTWIQGAECRAGNRAVVHHIILSTKGGRERPRGESSLPFDIFATMAPGSPPMLLPDGMAKLIPAGAKLVFQMHYTTNGTAQEDLSSVGLMLADPATVRKEVKTAAVQTIALLIPPKVADHRVDAWHTMRRDSQLLSLFPHMHLRGKSFRYEAVFPDGRRETLLDVPRYDFAWQQTYVLAEPKHLPRGTKIRCVAHYDNSAENIANPNPGALVHWGEQSWNEMLLGLMDLTPCDDLAPNNSTPEPPRRAASEQARQKTVTQ